VDLIERALQRLGFEFGHQHGVEYRHDGPVLDLGPRNGGPDFTLGRLDAKVDVRRSVQLLEDRAGQIITGGRSRSRRLAQRNLGGLGRLGLAADDGSREEQKGKSATHEWNSWNGRGKDCGKLTQ